MAEEPTVYLAPRGQGLRRSTHEPANESGCSHSPVLRFTGFSSSLPAEEALEPHVLEDGSGQKAVVVAGDGECRFTAPVDHDRPDQLPGHTIFRRVALERSLDLREAHPLG